jgi:mannose-1-phosphate guanylyltransferase
VGPAAVSWVTFMKGLILAGGKGTRLRPLTLNLPKPIVPVANRPFLLYQIDLMKSAGIDEIILSLSYQPRKIEDLLKDGADFDVHIRYAVESAPLGTAGAFKNAEKWIEGPTVVFNGDVLTSVDLPAVIATHREKQSMATLVLTPVEDPTAYGLVESDSSGRIHRFLEKPGMDEITSNTINAGIYVLEPSVLEHIPQGKPFSFERELFPSLLKKGEPVYAVVSDQYWIDIGTPAKYLEVHRDILGGKFQSPAIPTTTLTADTLPDGAFVDSASLVGEGVTIRENVRIESSVIGPNCKIDSGAHIVDSVIWSSNTIDSDARISGSILARGCYLGRSATLQPGTLLGGKSVVTDYSVL